MQIEALSYLLCPVCKNENATFEHHMASVECNGCGSHFDLIDGVIDFAPQQSASGGLAQWLMQQPAFTLIYENLWRPVLTFLGSSLSYRDEEQWLYSVPAQSKPGVIIDLAGGTGRYSRLLYDLYRPRFCFNVDLSIEMLLKARETDLKNGYTDIIHIKADAANLPFKTGVAQWLNCFAGLYLFENIPTAISEIYRALSSQSVFTGFTSLRQSGSWLADFAGMVLPATGFHFFEEAELKQLLETNGFQKTDITKHDMVMLFSAVKD